MFNVPVEDQQSSLVVDGILVVMVLRVVTSLPQNTGLDDLLSCLPTPTILKESMG